jgi:hypothetical protein
LKFDRIPGKVVGIYTRDQFKNVRPRQTDFGTNSREVIVQVAGEQNSEVRVRKDHPTIEEILGGAFMQDGAVFKFERVRSIIKLSLDYTTWDNRLLRCGVEVSPNAMIEEIVTEAQKRAEERQEEAKLHSMFRNGQPGLPLGLKRATN